MRMVRCTHGEIKKMGGFVASIARSDIDLLHRRKMTAQRRRNPRDRYTTNLGCTL